MVKLNFISQAVFCGIGLLVCTSNAPAVATITTFDVPGAIETNPASINSNGDVTGNYTELNGSVHGFLRSSDGVFTKFDVSGATAGTFPTAINSSGVITGYFWVTANNPQGFLRASDGTITITNVANSSTTEPTCINALGDIAGYYSGGGVSYPTGFIRTSDGTVTTFGPGNDTLEVAGIDDNDDVTGNQDIFGFVKLNGGPITSIMVASEQETFPRAINDSGTITGSAFGRVCGQETCLPVNSVGFVYTSDGTITTFAVPLSQVFGTWATSINATGEITGYYYLGANAFVQHGFVRDGSGGITSFDPLLSFATTPLSINDSGAITGYFQSATGLHGFIRNP